MSLYVPCYRPYNKHNTNIHAAVGIRTHDPSKRAAEDPRLRPHGHWEWWSFRIPSLNIVIPGTAKQLSAWPFLSSGMWRYVSYSRMFEERFHLYLEGFKVEAGPSLETSGITYPVTLRHIPEDWNPRLHRCENLKIFNNQLLKKHTAQLCL
jgi:hypothetical protein